jgi:predicted nuclease of predicted toxin-antitoxin system
LLDAHLPPSLKQVFIANGYYCIHTLDLELQNKTPDQDINKISIEQQLIVVTKDSDFYDTFLLEQQPYKLILVKPGNTSKRELIQFFVERFQEIIEVISKESILILYKN